jgi:hypothetical protein
LAAEVNFSLTSYADALRTVTDLGLRPSGSVCGSGFHSYVNGTQAWRGPWWQPVGVEAAFDQRGGFVVRATPAAAPDWLDRLRSTFGAHIQTVYTTMTPANCPARDAEATPPADAVRYVPREQVDTALRVTFVRSARSAPGYETALKSVSELGLRLADPCSEQARAQGSAPTWHAMGQEAAFARDGALVLAVGPEASEQWLAQAAAMNGALGVDAPYTTACA